MQNKPHTAAQLSAPCQGYQAPSDGTGKVPELGAQASAPGQLLPMHSSPPSVSRPARPDAAARQPGLDGYTAHQQRMQPDRATEPPQHAGRQQVEAAPHWCCARCRRLLPEGSSGPEACTCDAAPPPKRLNTGGSGRLHGGMEALNDGQMEKLLDLAQDLGLLPISSSASGGQPSWIPSRLAGSPSPKPLLQPGAAQLAVPGQPTGQPWPSSSSSQQQPAWPPTWMQAADLRLRRAPASLQAAAAKGSRTAEQALGQEQHQHQHQHQLMPAPFPPGQQQPCRTPAKPQLEDMPAQQRRQQQQQHRLQFEQRMRPQPEEQAQRPNQQGQRPQQPQQQMHQEELQQLQEQHQGQPSPGTPVDQRLPPPTGLPALVVVHGATAAQHAQHQPLPPLMLHAVTSLPVPLPPQPGILPRVPSEPLPKQHQQPRLRPYQPQPHSDVRPQQVQAEGLPTHPHPVGHQLNATLEPAAPQRPPAGQHTPARRQQERAQQVPEQARQQQQQQKQKQQKQKQKQKQQAPPAKRRTSQQAQQPAEGLASAQGAAERHGGPAGGPAAGPLAKAWKRALEQQAAEVMAWQQEQRRLLMETHEQQSKQLRVAHQVQLLQLERAHLLGLARQKSEPQPARPATSTPRLPLDHSPPPAAQQQQQQQQDGPAQTPGQGDQQQRWGEVTSFLRRVQSQHPLE